MPPARLDVRDSGDLISFTFDDLLRYCGRTSIGGVAHAFKAMERALPLLAGGEPPERAEISIESAFGGGGARDAFEMVTRAVTGGRFVFNPDLAPEAPPSPVGRYFFRLSHRTGTVVDLTLRTGLVLDEFVELAGRGAVTPAEEARLAWLKQDMADRLLAGAAADVYEASVVAPPTASETVRRIGTDPTVSF